MTHNMRSVLEYVVADGVIFAGINMRNGAIVRVGGNTLHALARRGYVTLVLSPDGGTMARPTDSGRAALTATPRG